MRYDEPPSASRWSEQPTTAPAALLARAHDSRNSAPNAERIADEPKLNDGVTSDSSSQELGLPISKAVQHTLLPAARERCLAKAIWDARKQLADELRTEFLEFKLVRSFLVERPLIGGELVGTLGHTPTVQEIATATGIEESSAQSLLAAAASPLSLETTMASLWRTFSRMIASPLLSLLPPSENDPALFRDCAAALGIEQHHSLHAIRF